MRTTIIRITQRKSARQYVPKKDSILTTCLPSSRWSWSRPKKMRMCSIVWIQIFLMWKTTLTYLSIWDMSAIRSLRAKPRNIMKWMSTKKIRLISSRTWGESWPLRICRQSCWAILGLIMMRRWSISFVKSSFRLSWWWRRTMLRMDIPMEVGTERRRLLVEDMAMVPNNQKRRSRSPWVKLPFPVIKQVLVIKNQLLNSQARIKAHIVPKVRNHPRGLRTMIVREEPLIRVPTQWMKSGT